MWGSKTGRWGARRATGELVGTKKGHVRRYHSYYVMTERGGRGKNRRVEGGGEGRREEGDGG